MKNAKSKINSPSPTGNRPELRDLSIRIRLAIETLSIEKREFAEAGGITAQTLSGYLSATREPSFSVLCGWIRTFHLDGNWLLTGEGEMFPGKEHQKSNGLPGDELSEKLTAEQRNMLTYKRLQTELGMPNERIAEGIEAIVMGKCVSGKKSQYGVAEEAGVGVGSSKVQEDGAEFGLTQNND